MDEKSRKTPKWWADEGLSPDYGREGEWGSVRRAEPLLLTRGQLATRLNMAVSTVNTWIRRGVIRPDFRLGRLMRFDPDRVIYELKEKETERRK